MTLLEEEEEGEEEEKARPRNMWIITGIRERGVNSMELIDKEEWRKKIKLIL